MPKFTKVLSYDVVRCHENGDSIFTIKNCELPHENAKKTKASYVKANAKQLRLTKQIILIKPVRAK